MKLNDAEVLFRYGKAGAVAIGPCQDVICDTKCPEIRLFDDWKSNKWSSPDMKTTTYVAFKIRMIDGDKVEDRVFFKRENEDTAFVVHYYAGILADRRKNEIINLFCDILKISRELLFQLDRNEINTIKRFIVWSKLFHEGFSPIEIGQACNRERSTIVKGIASLESMIEIKDRKTLEIIKSIQ